MIDATTEKGAVDAWRGSAQHAASAMPMSDPLVYKICPRTAWLKAEREGAYRGSADDRRDGFIHLSTASQLPGTAAKYFSGQTDLVLIAVDPGAVGESLRYEPSRGGELFPHLYADLPVQAVCWFKDLPWNGTAHDIPPLDPQAVR
jgi:uncharacterized protein (DUF952 family)